MVSSRSTIIFKYFNLKIYRIRIRLLDSLDQIARPFTIPTHTAAESRFLEAVIVGAPMLSISFLLLC